jgi:hypothetical protein
MPIRKIEITRNCGAGGESFKSGKELNVPEDISDSNAKILIRMKKAKEVEAAESESQEDPLLIISNLTVANLKERLIQGDVSLEDLYKLLMLETGKEQTRDTACKVIQDAIEVIELDERLSSILKESNLVGLNAAGSIQSKLNELKLDIVALERLKELEAEKGNREDVLAVIDEAIKSVQS